MQWVMRKFGAWLHGADMSSGAEAFCEKGGGRRSVGVLFVLGLVTLVGVFFVSAGVAQAAERPFTLRFNANINGQMQIIGNTLMTCDPSTGTGAGDCTSARGSTVETQGNIHGGAHLNDNDYRMINVPGSASSSELQGIPLGASVVWAGLYWGAEFDNVTSPQTAQLTMPGLNTQTITASTLDTLTNGSCAGECRYGAIYVFRPDELGQFTNGTYTVANIATSPSGVSDNTNTYGGWGLVVVYQHPSLLLNNIAVYDGYTEVSSGVDTTITVNGFVTPRNGPVISSLGVIAYEGDRETFVGNNCDDAFTMNGSSLVQTGIRKVEAALPANCDTTSPFDLLSDENNFFNSNLTNGSGRLSIGQVPNYQNQLGFDIANVAVPPGVLVNGASVATFSAWSTGDVYYPDVLIFSTNLHVPIIAPHILKTAVDLNGGGLVANDVIRYTISFHNSGDDTAEDVRVNDKIPANTTYVPGSLWVSKNGGAVDCGPEPGASPPQSPNLCRSDTIGGVAPSVDHAEFRSTGTCGSEAAPCVTFYVGDGATGTQGGAVPKGNASTNVVTVHFDVTVNPNLPSGTSISNAAFVNFEGQTIGQTFGAASQSVTSQVLQPPTVTKSFSPNPIGAGGASLLSIVVTNPGSNPSNPALTGIGITDLYPSGVLNSTSPPPAAGIVCSGTSTAPNPPTLIPASPGPPGISVTGMTIHSAENCTISVWVTSATAGVYLNTTQNVTSANAGSGGTASAQLSVGLPGIQKQFCFDQSSSTCNNPMLAGATNTLRFTLSNPSHPSSPPMTGLTFTDTLPAGVTVAAPAVTTLVCNGTGTLTTTNVGPPQILFTGGVLAGGASCTFTVNVTSAIGGTYPNTTSGLDSDQTPIGIPSNTDTLVVVAPPVAVKSFSPSSILNNGLSTLKIVITNPNPTVTITGVSFTDTYPTSPTGMTNSATPVPAISCTLNSSGTFTGGAASGTTIGMTGGILIPNGSCTITVQVKGSPPALPANYLNSTGPISSGNAGTGTAAIATLNVTNLVPPTVVKTFLDASNNPLPAMLVGGAAKIRITLTNPNGSSAITGVGFTDLYPFSLQNSTTPVSVGSTTCVGGNVTLDGGAPVVGVQNPGSVALMGATIPASGNCMVEVTNVTSNTASIYTNVLPVGSITTTNAGTAPATAASVQIKVLAPPLITKSFAPNPVGTAATNSVLTITITNPSTNTDPLNDIAVVDVFPSLPFQMNLVVNATTTCPSSVVTNDPAPPPIGFTVTGIDLAINTSCTITATVNTGGVGNHVNTTNPVTFDDPANPGAATGGTATATLQVGQPAITKCFSTGTTCPATPPIIPSDGVVNLIITLTNPTSTAMSLAAFTDTYPPTMTNTAVAATVAGCGGGTSITAGTGTGTLVFSGGAIPASGGTCVITKQVTATQGGTNVIPAGALTVSGGGTNGVAATAVISVGFPPIVTKTFTPSVILPGQTSRLVIRLENPNNTQITNVQFIDTFPQPGGSPTSLQVSSTAWVNTCALAGNQISTLIQGKAVGDLAVQLQGPLTFIPANGFCEVPVDVAATISPFLHPNVTSVVTSDQGNGVQASAFLTIMAPPQVLKSFTPNPVFASQPSLLTIRLTNLNNIDITGVTLTDTYPTGLVNAPTPAGGTSGTNCGFGVVGNDIAGINNNKVTLAGGSIPAGQFCEVNVYVVASAVGSYLNNTGAVTTTNAGIGTSASATLSVVAPLLTSKSFSPNPLEPGALPSGSTLPSQMIITLTNNSPALSLPITGVSFTDIYPAGLFNAAVPSAATSCTGDPNVSVAAAANGTSLSLLFGTVDPQESCTVTVYVVASTVGSYENHTGLMTTTSPRGTAPDAVGTLVVSASISGTVYKDLNHNANLESTESGTGLTLFAKLIRPSPTTPAVVVVPVNSATGAYSFTGLSGALQIGNYTIVIDDNNSIADITPITTAALQVLGWVATEEPSMQRIVTIPINKKASFFNDFGLFNGSKVTGRVFVDTGVGTPDGIPADGVQSGANNGIQDGPVLLPTEVGLAGVSVKATASVAACPPSGLCDTTLTDGSGNYALFLPPLPLATIVSIVETNLAAYLSTGGSAGTTPAGVYTRATDTTLFTTVVGTAGTTYSGVNFADVPVNNFAPNGVNTGAAGTVLFYPHTFSAGSGGSVVFSSSNLATPAITGWTHVIYRDDNCNATLDGATETTILTPTTTVVPAIPVPPATISNICIIVKEFIPAAANGTGEQDVITVTATFTYINSLPLPPLTSVHTVTDTTTVGTPSSLLLEKKICEGVLLAPLGPRDCTILVTTSTASLVPGNVPGSKMTYRVLYTNRSGAPLNNVKINDITPSYTKFESAVCGPPPLPPKITGCTITAPAVGNVGAIEWVLTALSGDGLDPGASGYVEFTVKID